MAQSQKRLASLVDQSTRLEQALLGAILLDNGVWDRLTERPRSGDFVQPHHRTLWLALERRLEQGQPCDAVLLAEELERAQMIHTLPGGVSYLGLLFEAVGSAANAPFYAQQVRKHALLRKILDLTSEVIERAQTADPQDLLEFAAQRLDHLAQETVRGRGVIPVQELMAEVVEYLDQVFHRPTSLLGLPTGLVDLDQKLAGLQRGDLIILAGRPAMGKSMLALNIAEHIALQAGHPVVFFSLEMSAQSLGLRLLSSITRIPYDRLRSTQLDDHEWPILTQSILDLKQAKLFLDDTPGLSVPEIAARARTLQRQYGPLGLVVVDYLQLLNHPERSENRTQEIAAISRALKSLAKQLDVPVLALSQLSRAVEQRADKRPILADLRESGQIEQDADVILFIYRDEVYHPDSPDQGTAELIVGKHRHGATGIVRVAAQLGVCRFDNLAPDWARPIIPTPSTTRPGRSNGGGRSSLHYDYC